MASFKLITLHLLRKTRKKKKSRCSLRSRNVIKYTQSLVNQVTVFCFFFSLLSESLFALFVKVIFTAVCKDLNG